MRLDGQAPRATVAGKSDELGERRTAADGPGDALKPTPRSERPRTKGTPSWMAVGRSGATCSAALHGRQAERGGDGLSSRSPGGQAQRAGQVRREGRSHQGLKPDGRDSARGAGRRPRARRRDAVMPR